jgi:cytidylate kinase
MSKLLGNIPIEKQIARHMQRWEMQRLEWARQTKPELREQPKKIGPYISFSRELASGGTEIAQRLAEKLGWQLYDRQIIEAIANRAHVRQELAASFDEHVQSELQTYLYNLFTNQVLNNTQYLYHLTEVVLGIARGGNAVIVGRGANFILPPEAGLRVGVVAPKEIRVQRLMRGRNITEKLATHEIEQADEERRNFLLRSFHSKVENPCAYDVVINTGHIDLEIATDLIIKLAESKLKSGMRPAGNTN